jgi:hypothetical protein
MTYTHIVGKQHLLDVWGTEAGLVGEPGVAETRVGTVREERNLEFLFWQRHLIALTLPCCTWAKQGNAHLVHDS